ncbi:hypothetical protein SSX86_031396 [Deinandra increscens subsp. villosa]|uniref:Leucine-rich repeat-containing N-terminal plant-type domain-containing protein n=1 Tax=Deinandra increscens subsp. villosa TaxID=3103831 RepID=A0AAP0GIR7_9ASTR
MATGGGITSLSLPTILLSIIVFILISIPPPSSSSCPPHQKQALLRFKSSYIAIFGTTADVFGIIPPFFQTGIWDPNSDCCTWDRVNCSTGTRNKTRTIVELHLDAMLPFNTVPVYLDIFNPLFEIQSLKVLDISLNWLEGEIPGDGFGNLAGLVHLDMKQNNINGSIPRQFSRLTSLRYLDLSTNFLQGELGPELGSLRNLTTLTLSMNRFEGLIPRQFFKLGSLRSLDLSSNTLEGGLSSDVSKLLNLESLDLSENSFSGQIPFGIGELRNVTRLDLSKNQLTGLIPSSIRKLTKLETLRLKNNMLTGEIPSSLFKIKTLKKVLIGGKGSRLVWNHKAKIVPRCRLQQLSMPSCGISGPIPEWISTQKDLEILDLSSNQLDGEFPKWLAKIDIQSIVLSDNKLTGKLTPQLFDSKKLFILALSRNNFSGELPENLGSAKGIMILMLSGNKFSGQIPMSISKIVLLMLLDLSRNRFSGDKVPMLFRDNFPFLAYIDLSYNELSGRIPVTFPTSTKILSLGENKFSGELPESLINLSNLEHLDIHDNDITGNLQDVIPFLIRGLQVLILRNNSLKGFIPKMISNLTSLRILDLSGNNLTGNFPPEIGNLANMIETPDLLPSVGIYKYLKAFPYFSLYRDNSLDLPLVLILEWKRSLQMLSSQNLALYSSLDLSNNRISGEIPATLGNLKSLKLLNVSHNRISGNIPLSFGNLESTETLDLSHNKISGSIPQSFSKLKQLTILDVSNNRLTGKIPTGPQMDTMNELNYFANNSGLCGMQIGVKCVGDIQPSHGPEVDDEKLSWISWEGTWVGFPVGLFSSILFMAYY